MSEVQGYCDPRFESVKEQLAQNLDTEDEAGVSYAVSYQGEMVVDLWGGTADSAGRLWEENTIVNLYSTTKTMCALIMHMLSDRGEVDFSQSVRHYWPEFAQNGKGNIPVSYLLCHAAGLAAIDEPIQTEDLYDHEKIANLLAAQAPQWEPGSCSGYHALTQGYLIGEVVKRITGQTLGQFFKEQVADPVQADFHIGTPDSCFDRIADLIPFPPEQSPFAFEEGSIGMRTWTNPPLNVAATRSAGWRRAEIPAANGHGNARAVVRAQTALVNGGEAFGVRLLSEEAALRPLEKQIDSVDLCLGVQMPYGLGYGLPSELLPVSPDARSVFWGGYGGSSIVLNYERRLVLCYGMNKMTPLPLGDPRGMSLHRRVWEATQ
ncbi:MAG: serine hydrolase domain-containing protein [Gammaproteobacteria bacterium]